MSSGKDPTAYVRSIEKELEEGGSPSKEAKNPSPVVHQDGTVLGYSSLEGTPTSAAKRKESRTAPTTGVTSAPPRREEQQLWNHVKHLETQLEFLTSSHNMPDEGGYNTELTQTMRHLAVNEGLDAERAPEMVARNQSVASADELNASAEDRKLWNAWDLRLNIGLEVGKWFGHELKDSEYRDKPAYDVGTDPTKTPTASLPYTEVMEVNKRMKTISAVEELTDKLDACRADWQDRLAVLQSAVKRSLKAAAATHRAPDATLQDHLGTEVKDLNRRFLVEVDTLLHQLGFTADIWGDMAKKDARLAALEDHNKELSNRLNREVALHSEARDALDQVAQEKADREKHLGDMEELHGKEQRGRMETEYKNQWLEQQLKETQEACAKAQEEAKELKAKLAREEKLHGEVKGKFGDVAGRERELAVQVDSLKRQLQKEEKLRTQVAKECADVHIELTHTLEDLEMERHNAAKQLKELEAAQKRAEELQAKMAAQPDPSARHAVEMVELKLKLEELTRRNELLVEEKEDAEGTADALSSQLAEREAARREAAAAAASELNAVKRALAEANAARDEAQRSNDLLFQELDELQNNREADAAVAELREALDGAVAAKETAEREASRLKDEVAKAEAAIAAHQEQHEATKASAQEAEASSHSTRQALLHDLDVYKQEVESLRNSLADEKALRAKKEGELAERASNLEEQKQLLAILRAEKSVLKTELAEYEKDLEKEVHDHTLTKELVGQAQHEAAAWKGKYEHELVEIKALEEARSHMTETEAELEKRLSAMAVERAQDSHALEEAKRALQHEKTAKEEAVRERDDAYARLEDLHARYEEASHEKTTSSNTNNELKRELALQQFERARMADKLAETTALVAHVQQVVERLNETKATQDAEIHALKSKLAMEQQERTELALKSGAVERQNLYYKDGAEDAKAQLQSVQRELDRVNKLLDQERVEKSSFSSTLNNTKQNFKDLMKEHQDTVEEKAKVEADLSHNRKKLQGLINEKATLARKLDEREVELEEKRKELEELTTAHDLLKADHAKLQEEAKEEARARADFELRKMAQEQALLDSQFRVEAATRKEEQMLADWRAEKNRYEEELLQLDLHDKEAKSMLQADIAQLQNSMTEVVATSQQKYHAYEEEVAHYKRQVHAGLVREEELQADLDRLKMELEEANQRLAAETLAKQKVEGSRESLEAKLVKLEAQNTAVMEELDDMQTEYGDLDKLRSNLVSENEAAVRKTEEVRELLSQSEAAVADLRKRLRAQEQDLSDTQNAKTSADLEVERLSKKLEAENQHRREVQGELERAKAKLQEAEKTVSRVTVENQAKTTEAESYRDKVREVLRQKSEVQIERERLEAEVARLKREFAVAPASTSGSDLALHSSMEQDLKEFRAKLGIQ